MRSVRIRGWMALLLVAVLAGCASGKHQAPVEDRGTSAGRAIPTGVAVVPVDGAPGASPAPVKPPPGIENAGKPGYYTVKPGDTLIRIGLDAGQNWRDIVRWNAIENPNLIEVGQVVRVVPPGGAPVADGVVVRPVQTGSVTVVAQGTATQALPVARPASAASAVAAPAVPAASSPAAVAPSADEDLGWIWPGAGAVLSGFDEVKNKGLDLGGKAGDAVLAAADGKVVYSGAGLRGYGNLIILKHNNTYLTAYAHNQTLLVKEEQTVRKGQKIAEMGNTDADRVKLHFEIRRQGKPVDPTRYLPAR